jgi:rhodanese-related sulfurtransferase
MVKEISVADAADCLRHSPAAYVLLDVREEIELGIASVQADSFNLLHIPMGDTPARLTELNKDKTIICMCHHGGRSAQVAAFLSSQGYPHVLNMAGGIEAWSQVVDTAIPRY